MAKEEENKDLEYDDLDDFDLEIPEIGVDPETDDRTPVRKLSTGFFQGVKDDLTDRRDAPRKLKAILPPSYSSSIDLADETLGTVGNLYNTLRDETRDGVKSVKRVARQALGKHDNKLPKWLGDRLKKMVGEGESERREPTVEEQRDDQIQNTLANIFELQVERDEEKDHEKSAEQAVRDALEGHRHESQVEQLFAIRQSVHRQVSYQDQVTARFQRKSLEMQYRQYFLTRDLFNVSETSARDIKEALQAIVKNTSLPEYRKLGLTEVVGQQFRERLVGGAQNKMAELGSGFFGRASESITKRFREKAQGWNQQLQSMAGMADMLGDSADVLDPYEMAGSTAGGAASGFIGRRLVFPLLRRMGVQNETVAGVGRDAQDTVSRLPRQINEWVKENRGAPGIAGFIADAIGGVGLDKGLEVRGVEDSLDPAFFDNQTRQSIVEIIPGYLSRIHHEIRGFREGMGVETPNPDGRMTYNLKERDFTTVEREREVIRDMIFNPEDLTSAFDRINDIIDGLDIERFISDDKVEDTRRVLSRHLMKEGLDGRDLKLERLSNSNAFGDNVPPEISAAIASAVQQRYNTRTERDEFGHEVFKYDNTRENKDRLANTRNLFDNMGNDVKDPRQTIQALLQIGGEDQLRSLGLLEYGSSGAPEINYDQVFRVIEQGGYDDLGGAGQRERREGRRYERYFENVEKLEEAKREREKEEAKRGEKEKTWFGRKKKRAGERFSNAARKMEEGSGLRDSARERAVERATAENRQLTPEQRQAFYGGTVSNTSTLYPVDVRNVQSLVETPVNHYREGDGDALGGAHRMLRSEEGRSHLKDATVQVVSDTFRKSKDRENWKSGAKAVKDKVYAGASGARAHGERLAKNLSENKTVQKVAGDERVQTLAEGGRDVYRLAESSLVIREALKLFDRGKELSKPAREALTKHLRLELQTGGEIRVDALAMPETYLDDVPENLRQELATHFERLIEKEIIQDDNLPTNLKELVQTTKDSFSENETVKSVREYVEQKTGEDSTLREKISTFQNTLQETSREVYDTNKTFQENVERGSERLKDATKKVYDRDQTPQENVERVTGKVAKAGKTIYDPSSSRRENVQHHKDRFYQALDKVYDRNLSIEDNAQRLSSKTGISKRRAIKVVEKFVKSLSRQEDVVDYSKTTFSPTTERYQTVRSALRQNEERTDLKRLAKEVYDTDLSLSENVRHLVNKTGISSKKATSLIESVSHTFRDQSRSSDITDETSVRHRDLHDSIADKTSSSSEKVLTTSEDREVRDEDKRSIRQQATELFNRWKKETEGEDSTLREKISAFQNTLQETSREVYDTNKTFQENVERGGERLKGAAKRVYDRDQTPQENVERVTGKATKASKAVYDPSLSRQENIQHHKDRFYRVLDKVYDRNLSIEDNAQRLSSKTGITRRRALKIVERFVNNLSRQEDTRDFSKATFSPTTERYRTVRNSLHQNEERTDLKRLAKEVYDTDLSVSENVRHLVNKTGVSTKKATNLIESLTRSLHGQSHNSDIVDEVSVRHGDHRDSVVSDTSVSTEKSLTTSEDREVRDEDKRSIRQQATELFNHWKKETEGEEENRSTKRWLSEESLEELRQDLSKRFSDSEVGEKVKESHLVRLIQEKLSRNDETVSNNLEVDNLTSRNDRVVDHRENETSDSSRSISRTYQEDTSDSLEDGLVEKRNRHRNHRSHAKKVEHVLSRLYRTDKSLEENARSLKRKTNVSLNKARRLVEQYTQNLTVSDDRHVRDIDLQERLQQGKEYLGESVHESRVEGSSWQNALQPVVQGEGYRVSGGVDTQWLPAQVVTDLKETINNRITRDEVKRSVNESALGEFITKITTSGRDNWTKVDRQEEVDKDVEKKPLEKLTKQLGRLTSVFRKRDGLQSPEELRGGFPDYTGVGGGVFDTPTALGPMGNFIDAHSAVAAPTTTPHVVDHQDREREVEDVTRPQDTTLSDILKDVRSILRGEEEGVGKDVHALVTHLDTAKDVDPERAQVAVLSRILENVEAIGQHITKEDEESWFNILDIGKKTGRVMSKTAGALGNFYLGGLKMLGGGMGGIGSMLRGGGRSVGRLLGNMVGMGRKDGIGAIDVYTKGQPQPTLTARGMESGEYFDSQTGDVISSVDDLYTLKGDVVDADGNLKATAGELSKGIFDRFGNRIAAPGLLSRLTDVASRAMGGIWGYMTFPTRMLLKGPQKLFSMARGIVNRVRDVYVKGERHPRILATIMKNGGYISATTGRPIYRIDQIDGEVRDRQGNVVLSHEDMRRGLVDWKGEPIGFLDRQLKRVLGAVKLPFKAAGWALGKARDVVGWTADKVGKVAGGIARGISSGVHFHQGNERLAETSNAQLEELRNIHKAIGEQTTKADDRHDTLKEVRDLLRKKIEGKQPHEWDTDGDGIRDGSWRELLGGDDEKDEDKVEKGRDEKDGSLLSTIMKLAGPLIGIIGGAINTILGKFSDLFSMLGGGLRIPGGGTRGPGPSVPPGAPAKGGWLKRGARGLWRGALGTAKFGLKWGARGLMWTGTKALPAMASFGGKALLAAGGVLASPFVLKAAAAGAVAYGGYRLYRHLTGVSLDDLGEHRMLQYGVDPSDDHRVAKMLLLEEKLRGNVSFDESTGVLDINEGGVDFESIYDAFELSEEVPEKVESFIEWLNLRFLPVYEANKKAIESNTDGKTLEDVDDLPIHQKKPFFDQATDVNPITPDQPHPYVVTTSPFGGETSITSGRIENDAIRIKEKLNEEYERYQSARDNAHRGDDLPPNHPLQQARRADERRRGGDHISTPTHNGDTHPRIQMARDSANQTRLRHHTRPEIIAQSDVVRITGTLNGLMDSSESIDRITAVDAVLLKTMGLRELEPAKVEVLMAMKREVVANSVYESNGLAAWEGSVDAMLDRYRGQFGISWYSWGDKGRWKTWFRQRFMKTLLSYLTSIKGVSSRPDKAVELTESNYSSQLRAAEQLSALEVSTADVDRLPIWELSESPWNGYTLNDDVTSLYPLIAYLRRMANDERDQALEEVDVRGVTERELRQSSDGSRRHQREERQEREQQGSEQRDRSRTQSTQRSEPSSGNGRGPLGGSNERSGGGGGEASAGEGLGTISEVPGGSHTPQRIPRNAGYQSVVTGMIEADIRDPEEQAMVMAQLGHESGNFTATEENLNYSADALRRVFSRYFPTRQEQQAYARKPEAIANKAYGGRMGNRDPGDGWKYRGRGFIQLTGRDNYERASQALGYDYVNNPDLVAEPEHAIRTSLWWWKDRAGLRQAAQSGDVERSTRLINGGTNGLQDRRNRYRDAIVLARSGEITRDAMEYLGQQHDDTGVMEQVEEQRNVQDLTTPDDRDSEIVVAQSGSRRATPTDDVDISLGREEPEEERRPVRQAVVSTASIDSSVGINEALNRDPDVAQQQRARQERVSEVQDTEDRQRQVVQNDTLLAVRQVLQDSLNTQQSMDGRLKTVVDLLREGNLSRERGVGDTSPSSDTSQAARNEQERERRSSSLNFDPRRVVDPVVQVTRRRSI